MSAHCFLLFLLKPFLGERVKDIIEFGDCYLIVQA
jgi:hypothetical protein